MAPSDGMTTSATAYLLHHVVLPPKLPQKDDYNPIHEQCLLDTVICTLQDVKDGVQGSELKAIFTSAINTIVNLRDSRDHYGNVSEIQLREVFQKLAFGMTEEVVPLEIKAQNAGLILTRHGDSIIFEPFELSPVNKKAMGSVGRLIRMFPGSASKIPISLMEDKAFTKSLAYTIAKMTTQTAPDSQPQVRKNGQLQDEDRDTTDPTMVTDWFMSYIAAFGEPTDTICISKNTREEVLWYDCKHPWRRSPLWLLVRVTLQLLFNRQGSMEQSLDGLYKAFVAQLLSRILNTAQQNWENIGSEVIYVIYAKLARRLRKMENLGHLELLHSRWTTNLKTSMIHAHACINKHWTALSKTLNANANTTSLLNLRPADDLDMALPELDHFLARFAARRQHAAAIDFRPQTEYPIYPPSELPTILNAFGDDKSLCITALEAWIEQNLQTWLSSHIRDEETCRQIFGLIQLYYSVASTFYAKSPTSLSIMYLSLLELWVAIDRSACQIYPLLCEYDPELNLDEFQCLVLPLRSHMQRLFEVERYVRSRRDVASIANPSVFRQFGHSSSFAVKHFNESTALQSLLSNIESDAAKKRKQKCDELANLKREYQDLMNRYNNSSCDFEEVVTSRYNGYIRTKHKKKRCTRCSSKTRADDLTIEIYEWPLSSDKSTAKATVFELQVPQAFCDWRDASMFLITAVLGCDGEDSRQPDFHHTLDRHHGLRHILSPHYHKRRIVPLSSIKPNMGTHRKDKTAIPNLEEHDVCLSNALRYTYYDTTLRTYTDLYNPTGSVVRNCMYQMPNKRSKVLERFLCRPPSAPDGITSNEVVASLADCPANLSLEEYKSFGMLPSGRNIVYSNILAQLATPSIDFAKAETHTLLLQVVGQCGVPSDLTSRVSHSVFLDISFCDAMLKQLETSLYRVSENWESWRAVATFIAICRRMLSLTSSAEVSNRSLGFLAKARLVGMKWLERLKSRAIDATDEKQRADLYSRATEVALLCTQTFDVEDEFISIVLEQQSAISMLLQCSIVVQENHKSVQSESEIVYKAMLQSWRSLLYRLFTKLRQRILYGDPGLDAAVRKNWANFQPIPEGGWNILTKLHEHWLFTKSGQLKVYFNLLTAELLVDGVPLARLPPDFIQHPSYPLLFGKSTLEVAPTDVPGMRFSGTSTYHGYKLHFGMEDGDMFVVAVKGRSTYVHSTKFHSTLTSDRLDLLPWQLFKDRLPVAFMENYIHWYDHDRGEVIFRTREDPWSPKGAEWRLLQAGVAWRLKKNASALTNILGETARTLSKIFSPLEDSNHIHTVLDIPTQSVHVHLPRLQLDFHIGHGDNRIQSRQYRGMVVDPDQTIGTLVGLTSKMVFSPAKPGGDRLVLIPVPHSFASHSITRFYMFDQHHVSVSINQNEACKVFAYTLDTSLGRVLESGDIQRRLFLALLHALTSHCLPDPLTRHTGTESALEILQSAAVRSFEYLTVENVDLLREIAALSPPRSFYPQNLMEMQKIEWDCNLPFLSQHPQLRIRTKDIIQQARTMEVFYPDNMPDTSTWEFSSSHLETRDAMRNSTFRVCNFGADQYTSRDDVVYEARDLYKPSGRSQRAYIAATLIMRNQAALDTKIPNLRSTLLQTHFRAAIVSGGSNYFDPSVLRFDSGWLSDSTSAIKSHWCDLHRTLPDPSRSYNKYDIVAWLSAMAFAKSADMGVIQVFALFYRSRTLATIKPPSAFTFDLSQGSTWLHHEIENIIRNSSESFDNSLEAELPKERAETNSDHIDRIQALFRQRRDEAVDGVIENLKQQWPSANPTAPVLKDIDKYINVLSAMPSVIAKYESWHLNQRFEQYLQQTSDVIARQDVSPIVSSRAVHKTSLRRHSIQGIRMTFGVDNVFAAAPPSITCEHGLHHTIPSLLLPCEPKLPFKDRHSPPPENQKKAHLEQLCQTLQSLAKSKCEMDYVSDLRASCVSLEGLQASSLKASDAWLDIGLQELYQIYLNSCKMYFQTMNLALTQTVASHGSLSDEIGLLIEHSPRICPKFWLSYLHRDRFSSLSESWKVFIVEYGLAVTQLHRAQRLATVSGKPADLSEELGHIGHSNWNPMEFPETLLLEAESGILIREEQEFIASQMRTCQDTNNIVLQLLMGGGKSSTIVPMLAAFFGDKEKLVRIIVAKPQSKQMLHMLVSKLGYLLNRRIYHMPFSRSIRPSSVQAAGIRKIYEECIAKRGVLLIQPEHILSFKLMAVEAILTGQPCATSLLDTQEYFNQVSRDIVDESDENFSSKFELIYTMGSQRSIEFAPQRWSIIQAVVGLIPRFARHVRKELPKAIEIQRDDAGRFPRVRILRRHAAHQVLLLVAKQVVEIGIDGLRTNSQSPKVQAALLRYITEPELTATEIAAVESSRFWTDTTKSLLLLVRGLIAGGILQFALSTKRWRVNFGLDPTRVPETQLAVPFKSKDCPSPRSEFSHPDVVILLSLLSYYYGGLTDEQLFDSFAHLQKSVQGAIQYKEWVDTASSDLPTAFRQLSGVSIKDRHQCIVEVFPSLRYSKKAIDYYLSSLVFPKAMKEFPQKLSASGWDIGAIKTHPVTGFSGTNDTLHLLPLTVKHLDLPSQSHTNALVLQYLLQEETSVELLPPRPDGNSSDAEHLLSLVVYMQPEVRVILDCGALILEQDNKQVAEAWLKVCGDSVQAVVFFDDEELSVLDHAGRIEPLQTSPFFKQLDVCLVYLDEAHTRGTDLKLPRNYRAAVTLGQGLVKDKLTQGCMRMRKLGVGQSVAFIVPNEISTIIRERTGKPADMPIEVRDVICWSILETWQDLKRSMPLWAVQGERFERNKNLLCGASTTKAQAEHFLEDEAQTLEARYKPLTREDGCKGMLKTWNLDNQNIAKIVTRCQEFEAMGFGAATLSEEQERELAPEIEEERQIERPARLDPEAHRVHPDVDRLVRTGLLVANSPAFKPAFQALLTTSAARHFALGKFPTDLLVTSDFASTVKPPISMLRATYVSDSYQRPVQFVLSVHNADSSVAPKLVIISPFEANQLIAIIRKMAKVTLHIFAPRANASFASLDKLELYNVGHRFSPSQVPRSLTIQLNLFTGSLYLRSFEEYAEMCDFLGLLRCKPVEGQQVDVDGFIDPPVGKWGLKASPVLFLRTLLMKIRREGEGVEKTHMGKILNGVRLEEADFQDGC